MLCRDIWFYEFPQPLSTLGYLLEPLYLRLLGPKKTVITVSNSTKYDLARIGYKPGNIHVISEGIRIAPAVSLSQIEKFEAPTLLSHGNIRPMKRTLEQVMAFELAKVHVPNLRLIVSGDASTPYGRKVTDYMKHSRYASSIHYAGHTTEAAKITLMKKCHAFLSTSVKEGWGLTISEAASQGTPSVVYDIDGLRDSVRSGDTGLITSANTPESMAASILELLSDNERYERLRTNGWQWSKRLTFDNAYKDFSRIILGGHK